MNQTEQEVMQQAALEDEGRLVRAATHDLEASGSVSEPVLTALVHALGDSDYKTRCAAAEALGAFGPAAATEAVLAGLSTALEDRESQVRRDAAAALGALGFGAAARGEQEPRG